MQLRAGVATATLVLVALVSAAPASAVANFFDKPQGLADLDARTGLVQPTAAQKQIVASLGAHASWNQFGTPL